jgi:hypothetical protein
MVRYQIVGIAHGRLASRRVIDLEELAELVLLPGGILERDRNPIVPQHHHRAHIALGDAIGRRRGKEPHPSPCQRHAAIRFAHVEHDPLFAGDAIKPAGKVGGRTLCGGGCRDGQGRAHADCGHGGGQPNEITAIKL